MGRISWDVSKGDTVLIGRIARRYKAICVDNGTPSARLVEIRMDLTACHANGCKLDMGQLASASDADLIHDVDGIWKHMDRETAQIGGSFLPRFAVS